MAVRRVVTLGSAFPAPFAYVPRVVYSSTVVGGVEAGWELWIDRLHPGLQLFRYRKLVVNGRLGFVADLGLVNVPLPLDLLEDLYYGRPGGGHVRRAVEELGVRVSRERGLLALSRGRARILVGIGSDVGGVTVTGRGPPGRGAEPVRLLAGERYDLVPAFFAPGRWRPRELTIITLEGSPEELAGLGARLLRVPPSRRWAEGAEAGRRVWAAGVVSLEPGEARTVLCSEAGEGGVSFLYFTESVALLSRYRAFRVSTRPAPYGVVLESRPLGSNVRAPVVTPWLIAAYAELGPSAGPEKLAARALELWRAGIPDSAAGPGIGYSVGSFTYSLLALNASLPPTPFSVLVPYGGSVEWDVAELMRVLPLLRRAATLLEQSGANGQPTPRPAYS